MARPDDWSKESDDACDEAANAVVRAAVGYTESFAKGESVDEHEDDDRGDCHGEDAETE